MALPVSRYWVAINRRCSTKKKPAQVAGFFMPVLQADFEAVFGPIKKPEQCSGF